MSVEFLLVTLLIVASPGTGAIYTIVTGISSGGRASLWAAFACMVGIIPHMLAAVLGLSALLHANAVLYDAIKYAGAIYLIYMAVQSLRDQSTLRIEAKTKEWSVQTILTEGILINLLNPKLSIFFVAFLPQFVERDGGSPLVSMLWLSLVFMLVTVGVFAFYGLFAASLGDQLISKPVVMKWLRRSFAASFAYIGVKLALTDR